MQVGSGSTASSAQTRSSRSHSLYGKPPTVVSQMVSAASCLLPIMPSYPSTLLLNVHVPTHVLLVWCGSTSLHYQYNTVEPVSTGGKRHLCSCLLRVRPHQSITFVPDFAKQARGMTFREHRHGRQQPRTRSAFSDKRAAAM